MKPLIVINLKTYQQGKKVIKLAKSLERVSRDIILGCQPTDIYELARKTKLKIYSQHVDYFKPGRNTGFVLPESIKEDGAIGSFLNHSEHRLKLDVIKKTIVRCRNLGLKTIVFAKNLEEAKKIEKFHPTYIIIEPPELIAGKISVSQAKPELIQRIAENVKSRFLVGAGIHSRQDIDIAIKLGASGVALSSAITTSRNPEKKLRELLE